MTTSLETQRMNFNSFLSLATKLLQIFLDRQKKIIETLNRQCVGDVMLLFVLVLLHPYCSL